MRTLVTKTGGAVRWMEGALALAVLASGAPAAAAPAKMSHDEIVKEIGRLEIAAVEAKDFNDLKKLYATDVVDITPSHMLVGFDKLVQNFAVLTPQINDWQVSIVPGTESIIVTDEMAVASNLQVWRARYIATGERAMEMVYRQTDVWQRQPDGSWKIVHAHSSIPIDPTSDQPICLHTDGKCPVPNFPRQGMNVDAVRAMNASYGDIFAKIPPAHQK